MPGSFACPAHRARWLVAVFGAVLSWGAGACSSDLLDVDVNLQRQTTSLDFGTTQGTIPVVTCDPVQPSLCDGAAGTLALTAGPTMASVQVGCDASTDLCFAEAHATALYPVDILQDDDFVTKVERGSVVIVRALDIAYTVPVNTLTFEVPQIQISVGPAGSAAATDPGVVPVGTTSAVSAGQSFGDSGARHLVISDSSAARAFIEQSIMNKQTLVFIATLDPRLAAGAPIPAGTLQLDLLPRLTLGLPR
jgi:hypothetical protein